MLPQISVKILFISPAFKGGIGGHASRVAEKLQESGFKVKLMRTPHVPVRKLKNPSFAILSCLRAIFSNESFDVVHAFNIPSAFAMKCVRAKKRVLSVHGVYSEQVDALHSKKTAAIAKIVEKIFDMRPYAIEQRFKLRNPIYSETASYGHMGREPKTVTKVFNKGKDNEKKVTVELFTWEKLDYVKQVKDAFKLK